MKKSVTHNPIQTVKKKSAISFVFNSKNLFTQSIFLVDTTSVVSITGNLFIV